MNAMSDVIQYLETATKILDEHVKNPQNYNTIYANDFELKSWELFKIANDLKYISNRYGVT